MVRIESSWAERLEGVFASAEWERLAEFVRREYANELLFPPAG